MRKQSGFCAENTKSQRTWNGFTSQLLMRFTRCGGKRTKKGNGMREKLIEILKRGGEAFPVSTADHLLANGVTLDNQVSSSKWISVKERLPEIVKTTHAWKNVYRRSDRVLCACLQKDGKRMVKEGYMEFFNDYPEPSWRIPGTIHAVTHWMPLPEPPKGE